MNTTTINREQLSFDRRQLLEFLFHIYFGQIQDLHVRECEPVLDPLPTFFRRVRPGCEHRKRHIAYPDDYQLKKQVIGFFDYLDRFQDGVIAVVKVQDGLPFEFTDCLPFTFTASKG